MTLWIWYLIFMIPYISDIRYFWHPIFLIPNISDTRYFRYPIYLIPNISDMIPDISDTPYLWYSIFIAKKIFVSYNTWIIYYFIQFGWFHLQTVIIYRTIPFSEFYSTPYFWYPIFIIWIYSLCLTGATTLPCAVFLKLELKIYSSGE